MNPLHWFCRHHYLVYAHHDLDDGDWNHYARCRKCGKKELFITSGALGATLTKEYK